MPAETHQCSDGIDVEALLWFLAEVAGVEPAGDDLAELAATRTASVGLDDELSVLWLWDLVVDEYGERAVGELHADSGEPPPETFGELAGRFAAALGSGTAIGRFGDAGARRHQAKAR